MIDCPICGRSADGSSKLCKYHLEAKVRLEMGMQQWTKAAGITWNEYLDQVYEREELGVWVREVIDYLRS
ncbi:MAG: hypothetical protein ACFE7R_01545 [Candidatus Hodarchaeota archaeon]